MNNVQYSDEAYADIAEIKRYITEDLMSPKAATNTVHKTTKKIRLLRKHAEIGSPLSSVIDIETDYRYLISGNYLTFYRVDGKNVYIIRVLYGGRDYVSILFDESTENESDEDD